MIDYSQYVKNTSKLPGIPAPILVAHQPEFYPWLGFISKARMADVYFILDTVQFMKEHWHNRNKIRQKSGWLWLVMPVLDSKSTLLMWPEPKIDNTKPWKRKHLNSLKMCYSGTKFFDEIFSELETIYAKDYEYLIDFNEQIIRYAFKKFKITAPVYRTSQLNAAGYDISGIKSDIVIRMCEAAKTKTFVFGPDGKKYIEKEKFYENDITFIFQNFIHPVYNQKFDGFESHMSFVDLLFNYGDESVNFLQELNYDTE
jgi:hypothetical protein